MSSDVESPDHHVAGAATGPSRILETTIRAMLSMRDEASTATLAKIFLARWHAASPADRMAFIAFAGESLGPDQRHLLDAVEAYRAAPSPATEMALFSASVSQRQRAFRVLNGLPGGMATLIDMRETMQRHRASGSAASLAEVVDAELSYLLSSWLSAGSLSFREINWESPAALVEKIITYENVHEVRDWSDLRRRLQPDRRCYGFFHPLLADEPIIFVEIALTTGIAASIEHVLLSDPDPELAERADTAVFYSISNCHDGLRGIPFGGLLLKRAIEELRHEFPQLSRFATLSPIPGFRRWLMAEHPQRVAELDAMTPAEREQHREWLLHRCAVYLTSLDGRGRPLDAVARFHLSNGAQVTRLNWNADPSAKAVDQSLAMMVNYGYELDQLDANHEALVNARTVTASAEVTALAAGAV